MRYNDEQLKLAEYILKTIKENGSCMDKNELLVELQEMCDYSDLPEITLRFLEEDKVIEYWGSRYIKFTNKGCDVAFYGLHTYNEAVKWWNRTLKVKDVISIIIGIISALEILHCCV